MKPFDFEKHPDIDVVAWDKDGECRGYIFQCNIVAWGNHSKRFAEYDIDPNTPNWDWAKSKQIRPSKYLIDEINSQINISSMDRVELRKIKELNEELFRNREGLIAKCVGYREKIAELEKVVERKNQEIDFLESELQAKETVNYDINEKLIDFWKEQFQYYLKYNVELEQSKVNADIETELYRQAIERIEKHDLST